MDLTGFSRAGEAGRPRGLSREGVVGRVLSTRAKRGFQQGDWGLTDVGAAGLGGGDVAWEDAGAGALEGRAGRGTRSRGGERRGRRGGPVWAGEDGAGV